MNQKQLEKILEDQLEQYSLEQVLEQFDLTPLEAFVILYTSGLLDEDILEGMLPSDF